MYQKQKKIYPEDREFMNEDYRLWKVRAEQELRLDIGSNTVKIEVHKII